MPVASKRKKPTKARNRQPQVHDHPNFPVKGVVFDLCCGKFEIASGFAERRGKFRVEMESHGFELVLVLNEEQAEALGGGLVGCIAEARKGIN